MRTRCRCQRLPDNAAAAASSPYAAPVDSVANGGSQSSSHHGPGVSRIPPRDQLRAAQCGKSPWGPTGPKVAEKARALQRTRGWGGAKGVEARGRERRRPLPQGGGEGVGLRLPPGRAPVEPGWPKPLCLQ